ncbi:type II CRISPR RNA-guided endonuclease Cas9 [Floccifex sp.]|uniref:type II CRISPR RNA-guided endonuclease Cas9 n=1 Tax=Floccifex sp. TaxID=2815810 RepID=UPI003F04F164
MNNNYVLGLDIGIASIGWMLFNQDNQKMIDMGVSMFDEAQQASEARNHRSARRNMRHKNWRKRQMIQAFIDFGFINKEDGFNDDGSINSNYLSFRYNNEIKDETVYHLRNRGLSEQLTNRELLIALYNICKTRGHFLLESVNFEDTDTISFDVFSEKFYELTEEFVQFQDKEEFEKLILKPIFEQTIKANTIKKEIKNNTFTMSDEYDKALQEICLLICNNKADLNLISESVQLKDNTKKVNIIELLKKDELNEFLEGCIELYDIKNVAAILHEYKYICQKDVALLEEVKEIYHKKDINDPDFEKEKKVMQSRMISVNAKHPDRIRAVKNIENKFPNGLYVKEARAILKKQQEYNPQITNEFIDICLDIIKSRIPYYVGPLGKEARNGWVTKTGNFKYSYNYSKGCVDESKTIEEWKKRMISHCTYLPEEFALPKGSFIAETFGLVNELNILKCKDENGDDYFLTANDKFKLFDELFLQTKGKVSYKDIAECLNLKSVGTVNKGTVQKFKLEYTLYFSIVNILPELKLNSITEIFSDSKKIDELERIILDINLFDEEDSKKDHFIKLGYSKEVSNKLSKLKSKSFFAFSKKFLLDTPIDQCGLSILEKLFEDNPKDTKQVNEQMTIITNAVDMQGNPIDFTANKYEQKFKNGECLGIDLLLDDGKPVIPVSRGVIRSLNECLKLYNAVIKMYGVPSRVVVETARDLKDNSQTGEVKAKHYNKMEDCYNDILKQTKNHRNYLEDWDTIASYLTKNKQKIELYIRQDGRDMISGEKIDIHNLQNYEIDHILPRGFGDNSMDNKMLINRRYNSLKNNRVPLMYIEDGAYEINSNELITVSDYEKRVNELFKMELISEDKRNRLLLKNMDEVEGFVNRNLVDTRYIIREFMSILRAFNKVNGYQTDVVALKSSFTDLYKKAFYIRKNRDIGDQHHALDAATLVLADQILRTYYPYYDKGRASKGYQKRIDSMNKIQQSKDKIAEYKQKGSMEIYQETIRNLKEQERNETRDNLSWIRYMYFKTFGHHMKDSDSLLNTIKNTTPLYSLKVNKNYKGAYFNATIYSPKEINKEKDVLSILGVNDDKKAFNSINCVAVDFYKYTDKKGRKKHVAIHIPKVIIDDKGNINQEQYKTLIKKHYKVPELLDENGNIKTYYFKFRGFRNDLIYDTKNCVIQKFNVGSIVNLKMELKHIYNFAYNDIYADFIIIKRNLVEQFNIKDFSNKNQNQVLFDDVNINELIEYCIDNLMVIEDENRYEKAIRDILKGEKALDLFIEKMQYLNLIVNRPCTPPTIVGQYMPVANNSTFDDDSQYVKIKCTPLGIRYTCNEQGTIMIEGPKYHENAFTTIKKEQFSWRICPEVI